MIYDCYNTVGSYLKCVGSIQMSAFTGVFAVRFSLGCADARTPQKRFLQNRDALADSRKTK